jgi:hypothetical protein
MTGAEWLSCTDSRPMLNFLRGKTSDRKLRLFGAACLRRMEDEFPDQETDTAVRVAEEYADGLVGSNVLKKARTATERLTKFESMNRLRIAASQLCALEISYSVSSVLELLFDHAREGKWLPPFLPSSRMSFSSSLLREITGTLPFKSVSLEPDWLAWNDRTIPKLAQAIYDDRAFDRLAILADALEDAGCTDAAILAHCRQPGTHVRGCWVVDLLLGKE